MHDPMVVAHEVHLPIPRRDKWREIHDKSPRWSLVRRRRTNPANLGEPVYRWWRPAGWTLKAAGRVYRMRSLATIWHVEPGGRDAFEVCKHASRWRWHVWHWKVQIPALQELRARLFDRCEECGRKGRPNFSHQWDGKRLGWWKLRGRPGLYHNECSSLVFMRRGRGVDEKLIRYLFAGLRVERGLDETELLGQLTDAHALSPLEFNEGRRLWMLLGYKRDDDYQLVKAEPKRTRAGSVSVPREGNQ